MVYRIIKDKFRYCEWDRNHPKTNTEVEIYDLIKAWMLDHITTYQQIQAEEAQNS